MTACVILHNMIVEDERDLDLEYNYHNVGSCVKPTEDADEINAFLETYRKIENHDLHNQLQHDLIEHRWRLYGGDRSPFLFISIHVRSEQFGIVIII